METIVLKKQSIRQAKGRTNEEKMSNKNRKQETKKTQT